MKFLVLSLGLFSYAAIASQTLCTNGSEPVDPKHVPDKFTGSINCRDSQTNYPIENLTYRKGVLVQRYQYSGTQLRWVVEYFDDGKLKSEIPYSEAGLDGTKREYYENGKVKEENVYEGGNRVSVKHFTKEAVIESASYYGANGETTGREWYENGVLTRKEEYENGKTKQARRFDAKGQLTSESVNGNNKVFYENGKLKAENFYQEEKLLSAKHYSRDGKLDEISLYDNDSHVDSEITYNPDRSILALKCGPLSKAHETLSKLCGFKGPNEVTLVSAEGKIVEKPTYVDGKVVSQKTFADGRITGEFPTNGENGVRKTFHPNGKVASESTYEKNQRRLTKEYYENGNLREIQAWDENGTAMSKLNFNEQGEIIRMLCKDDAPNLPDFRKPCAY